LCTFFECEAELQGGGVYSDISKDEVFGIVGGSNPNDYATSFISCKCTNGKGGGIYLKLGDVDNGKYQLAGDLLFTDCSALVGSNVYIDSMSLGDIPYLNSNPSLSIFNFNYYSSLLESSNELCGSESLSEDVELRKYLCPLQNYSEVGLCDVFFIKINHFNSYV
jgi:hypothetical protein